MKVNIDKTMDDIVSISNQISGLKMLLDNKKHILSKYFEKSGERSLSNQDCTVYVQERTTINYDVEKITQKLGKNKASAFIDKEYKVIDWDRFVPLMKKHGITPDVLRAYISVEKKVNDKKLSKLYERGIVSLTDLEGCYDATVNKSVALRLKDANREIPIAKES